MAGKKFLKSLKDVKKGAGTTLLNTGARGVGFLGSKALGNVVVGKINPKYKNVVGPAQAVLGILIEGFVNEPAVAAIGQGMSVAGIDRMSNDFIPEDTKKKMYLDGFGEPKKKRGVAGTGAVDWQKIAEEAVEEVEKESKPADQGTSGMGQADDEFDPAKVL